LGPDQATFVLHTHLKLSFDLLNEKRIPFPDRQLGPTQCSVSYIYRNVALLNLSNMDPKAPVHIPQARRPV
jgi:hypothetical protein